jgi:ribosome biogenesis GTPase
VRLTDLGWDAAWAQAFEPWKDRPDVLPGRVAIEFNYLYRVYGDAGEVEAVLAGRMKHRATSRGDLPAVGDWVVLRRRRDESRAAIIAVLPRRTRFSRRMAGHVTDEQVVAANGGVVFITMGLDGDFNLRRLERYLLVARESGAAPVVLLTKPDCADDLPAQVAAVGATVGDVPVHVLAPKSGEGLDQLSPYLTPGHTAALLGSSGVGKTTIINRLTGDESRRTRDVRESDARGRHTTTHRELVVLPTGGLIIDTPGMRELQLWEGSESVGETFDDIQTLARACRFGDCRHRNEPRCAVKAAVEAGELAASRFDSYLKLQDELAFVARQQDQRAQIEEKRRSRVMGKALKQHLKTKR